MPYEWLQQALERLRDVEPHEVTQALSHPHRLPVPAHGLGVGALVILSRTAAGRALAVAVRPVGGFDSIIIGARDMKPDELAHYEKWEATR